MEREIVHRRHDISDGLWDKLEGHLPEEEVSGEGLQRITGHL